MKTTLLILTCRLLMCINCFGQQGIHTYNQTLPSETEADLKQFLVTHYTSLWHDSLSLELVYKKSASASIHYTFVTKFMNIPILNSNVKMSTNGKGQLISVSFESDALKHIHDSHIQEALNEWKNVKLSDWLIQHIAMQEDIKYHERVWDFQAEKSQLLMEVKTWNRDHDQSYYYNASGNLIYYYNHARYANKKDTLITARVFIPDPLTKLGLNYGGSFIDNGDTDQGWMATAYDTVQVLATWDSSAGLFLLENKWAVIDEFESPVFDPVNSTNSTFFYNRSQSGFEDCNALYHITHFQDYIQSIGYDTLMDMQLRLETHGQLGGDNSVFMRNGGNPTISFGTGGVDDAEDADVIIHEYSHGLSWSANQNDNFTTERSALDEGIADYFATSYSRVLNPFNWQYVFSWDGPVWGGRTANSSATYPSAGSIYAIGEIWNSAMSNIWTDLGPVVTDKLMLETLHFFTNSTTFPEAAQYMLKADTLLFGGAHHYLLCVHFSQKGILQGGCAPALSESMPWSQSIRVHHSLGFAQNTADLCIEFPMETSGTYYLYSIDGKLLKHDEWTKLTRLVLPRDQVLTGNYILKLKTEHGVFQTKIAKW